MTQVAMPFAARDRLLDRFGPAASAWIDDFGETVAELCQQWGLDALTVRAGGTGAVVECVSSADGTRYALELSPDRAITEQESAALTYWAAAPTVVDLVNADATRTAILLEWLPTEVAAETLGITELTGLIMRSGVDAARLQWTWQVAAIQCFTAIFTPVTYCGSATGAGLSPSTRARVLAIQRWTSPISP